MIKVDAVTQLGIKGGDVVVATLNKANKLKDQYTRPVSTALGKTALAGGSAAAEITKSNKDTEKHKDKSDSKLISALSKVASATEKVGQGFASLNPTELIRAVAGAGVSLASGLARGAGNALWGGVGDAAAAAIEYAGRLTDTAISMASNSVQAVKTAIPIAMARVSARSAISHVGLGERMGYSAVSQSELGNMAQTFLPMYGKLNKNFLTQLDRLYTVHNGETVNRNQANALSQGNFSALGSTKGWALNKIMGGLGDVPPELRQMMTTALLGTIEDSETAKEKAWARQKNEALNSSDLAHAETIAALGGDAIVSANNALHNLTVQMVSNASSLNGILTSVADGMGAFLRDLQSNINEAGRATQGHPANGRYANRGR